MRLTSILSVVALAGAATAAIPEQAMANDMKEITDLASQTNEAAQGMSPANMVSTGAVSSNAHSRIDTNVQLRSTMLTGLQKVVEGFYDIIELARKDIAALEGSNKRSVKALIGGPSARNLEKRNSDLGETGGCPAFKAVSH